MTVPAFAKINVDLRVLYKRPDGFHELRTIFQTISVADRIAMHYEPSPELSISVGGNVEIADNLIARAARLVMQEARITGRLTFELEKRIPMGAGLGGGSSDAATVLLALPALIEREIAPERLHALAAELGSDVPFFLYGGTAVGLGRGDELYPLPDLPDLHGLLVSPAIHVSTVEAYRSLSSHLDLQSVESKQMAFAQVAWTQNLTLARNDFEAPVFEHHPELAAIRETLEESGAVIARMTGSGSSLFALYNSAGEVSRARGKLSAYPTAPFSFITRAQYR